MSSYQDIEARLGIVERKLEFLMNSFKLAVASPIVGAEPKVSTMLDLYHEAQAKGENVKIS